MVLFLSYTWQIPYGICSSDKKLEHRHNQWTCKAFYLIVSKNDDSSYPYIDKKGGPILW